MEIIKDGAHGSEVILEMRGSIYAEDIIISSFMVILRVNSMENRMIPNIYNSG